MQQFTKDDFYQQSLQTYIQHFGTNQEANGLSIFSQELASAALPSTTSINSSALTPLINSTDSSSAIWSSSKLEDKCVLSKRVILVHCDNGPALESAIAQLSIYTTIATARQFNFDLHVFYAVAWYDFRTIKEDLDKLKVLYLQLVQNPLSYFQYSSITDPAQWAVISTSHFFKFIQDGYDIFYVSFDLSQVNGSTFLQDLIGQVSMFCSLYLFEPLQGTLNVYKCRFHDIRKSFLIRRLNRFEVGTSVITVSGTLVELYEKACQCPILSLTGQPVNLSSPDTSINIDRQEWSRYQNLKHRRLASMPFRTYSIPEQNVVDISRIQSGQDKRTTLLIRNIPNRVNFRDLKDALDVVIKGEYDFLCKYNTFFSASMMDILTQDFELQADLRFDFENHCNVGYAFISFPNVEAIIKFYGEFQGRKWTKFNSEKICQLAYAKIQGKDCLIQKFQRSRVMQQNPDYRPHIYYTEGSLKGQEQMFPT